MEKQQAIYAGSGKTVSGQYGEFFKVTVCLSDLPKEHLFEYNGKKYTPKSFAASLELNMDDYVSITSFTNHPMNSKCQLAIQDNWAWGSCYNVNLDDLMNEQ